MATCRQQEASGCEKENDNDISIKDTSFSDVKLPVQTYKRPDSGVFEHYLQVKTG